MSDAVEGVSERAAWELFCEDEEPERVTVPGHPESWVELLPMDAAATNKYASLLSPARPVPTGHKGQALAPAVVDVAPANEHLICETVVNWHLVGKKQTHTPPDPGRQDPERARKEALRALLRGGRRGMSAALLSWLLGECLRVNHLTDEDQGSEEHPGN